MYTVKSGKGKTVCMIGSLTRAKRQAYRIHERRGGTIVVLNESGMIVWSIG